MKYRFVVVFQTPQLKKISDFLSCLDLGHECFAYKEVMSFSYTKEEKPVSYFKDLIKQAVENSGHVFLYVEGGKIE